MAPRTFTPHITDGYVDFDVPSLPHTCQTYYKIFGRLTPGARPLVALHGGPGVGSVYLEALADIITPSHPERVLIVYDQLGCGKSTHLRDKMGDTSFWTVDLFIDELENLLKKLGVVQYDLLGHSWGGMLAAEIAIRQKPLGLHKLIIFSSPASMKLWVEAQEVWRAELPEAMQRALDQFEEDGVETPEYQAAVGEYYMRHLCTIDPMPEGIAKGLENLEDDPTVYLTMNGPSEFNVTGSLKTWSVVNQVHAIKVPTLITNGALDEARDSVLEPYVKGIPDVKWVRFEKSSHMAHYEEQEKFMSTISTFLYG